jgi:hypothetical protein
MTTTLIISEEKLRQFTDINDNLDSKLMVNAVREAQDIYLQRLTGTSLYEYILAQIDANTLSGHYKTLVDDFIQPMLIYASYWECLDAIYTRPRNNGLLQPTGGENSEKADGTWYNRKRQAVENKMNYYSERLTNYLIQNQNDFPQLNDNGPFWKQNPDYGTQYRNPIVFNRRTRSYHFGEAVAAGLRMGDSRYPQFPWGSNIFYPGPRECC